MIEPGNCHKAEKQSFFRQSFWPLKPINFCATAFHGTAHGDCRYKQETFLFTTF
jgi:hypothetical protein